MVLEFYPRLVEKVARLGGSIVFAEDGAYLAGQLNQSWSAGGVAEDHRVDERQVMTVKEIVQAGTEMVVEGGARTIRDDGPPAAPRPVRKYPAERPAAALR